MRFGMLQKPASRREHCDLLSSSIESPSNPCCTSDRLLVPRMLKVDLTRHVKHFSSSSTLLAHRAIVYQNPGDPTSVLKALTFPSLSSPGPQHVNVRFLLSPINPADINVVEGVYPARPSLDSSLADEPIYVGGNEGLAEVTEVGSDVTDVKKGDRVVMAGPQLGTWSSGRTVLAEAVIKVPEQVSEVNGATMTVSSYGIIEVVHVN